MTSLPLGALQCAAEIDRADIAVVLVSQAFLNSPYCRAVEIAGFLRSARTRGLKIYPIILSPCNWQSHSWLRATQFQPRNGKTIEADFINPGKRKGLYLKTFQELRELGRVVRRERAALAGDLRNDHTHFSRISDQ